MAEEVKIKVYVDAQEEVNLAKKQSELHHEIQDLERKKKLFNSDIKSSIDAKKKELDDVAEAIRTGFYYKSFSGNRKRNVEQGQWDYYDDNGRYSHSEKFKPTDYQMTTDDVIAAAANKTYESEDGKDVDLDALKANIKSDEPEVAGQHDIDEVFPDNSSSEEKEEEISVDFDPDDSLDFNADAAPPEDQSAESSAEPVPVEGEYIEVQYPGSDYMQPLNTPDPEPKRGKGGRFTRKSS